MDKKYNFTDIVREEFPGLRFYDIGAIIYYLKAVPWQISNFSVNRYYDSLKKIHNKIQKKGFIDIEEHRFMIVAKKKTGDEI
ncbi:MAG: hypothetical protein ACQEQF_13065 [Bacillota bacterium]